MRPSPLPSSLTAAFSTADARAVGVPASRLRRSDLHHPTHGAHARGVPSGLQERALAFAAGLPDGRAFSHLTAARLLGIPLPERLEQEADDGPLHVMAETTEGHTRRGGCTGHRGLESRTVVTADGVRVVGPEDTWCDLGEMARRLTVEDLVVAGDAVLGPRAGGPSPTWPLRRALESRVRPRGTLVLLDALALVRPGVRSPMESRARLVVVRAGLPEPELNGVITDAAGEFLGEGDLVWREQKVVAEYQGAEHASRRRRSLDASRRGGLEDEDWRVVEIWAEDVHRAGRRTTMLLRLARALGVSPSSLHL